MNNTIVEYINGMEVVKVFNRDGESYHRFETDVKNYRDFTLDWFRACWLWMALYTSILPCVALVLLSSLLAACVTAFAGPISFVGIAVPHLVRQALGSARPLYVLPGCALGGATFCLLCDLIARSLFAPTELSISSVTAVFGAPIVIWLLVRRHSREGAV